MENKKLLCKRNISLFVIPATGILSLFVTNLGTYVFHNVVMRYDAFSNNMELYNAFYIFVAQVLSFVVVFGAGLIIKDLKEIAIGFGCRFLVGTVVSLFLKTVTAILYIDIIYSLPYAIHSSVNEFIDFLNVLLTTIGTFFLLKFVKEKVINKEEPLSETNEINNQKGKQRSLIMEENIKTNEEFVESGNVGTVVTENVISDKSKVLAAVLCFFLGTLGIHRFYLGKGGTGFLMLLLTIIGGVTTGIFIGWGLIGIVGLWEFIDFFRILFGSMKDGSGKKVK